LNPITLLILLTVIAFVLVHVFGGILAFLSRTPRSVWLSVAGGVSVAYVFMHLLPELAEHQELIGERARNAGLLGAIESHAYLIAILGLGLFYGVERFAGSKGERRFGVAMSLHFIVNDQGLRQHHGRTYHRYGRWLLAAAPVAGLLLGLVTNVSALLLPTA
jgi:hypothetical protein